MEDYKSLRQELFDVRMKLALLKSKEDNPLYKDQIMKLKQQLNDVKTKMKKYKLKELEKKGNVR